MSFISYLNTGATRNQPLDPQLVDDLSYLQDMGLGLEVFSGGQPAKGSGLPRVGSTRHDHGRAADVYFTRDGERLDWRNEEHVPIFQDVVRRGREAGLTGFGAGEGYMAPGSMHVGYGAPAVWGAGGRGSTAPDWLREAYYGAGGGPAAVPDSAGLGDTRQAGVGEEPSAFRQWYNRTDDKLRSTLGLPDRDSITDEDRARHERAMSLIQIGQRLMNEGYV